MTQELSPIRPKAKSAPRKVSSPSARQRRKEDLEPLTGLDLQRGSLGYALRRAQVRAYEQFFESFGSLNISPARLTALWIIATQSGINQAELAKRLEVAGPSALKLVDALEGSGLISRIGVVGDRRCNSLVLTDAGRMVYETITRQHAEFEERLTRRLSAAERKQLLALLERVAV